MKVVMLGAPGAGKGTQGRRLAEKLGVPQISTGDLFRSHCREETDLGTQAQEFMDTGRLVPDPLVVDMVNQRLLEPDAQGGYILDGFPRTLQQAEALEASGTEIDRALDVRVPAALLLERLTGRLSCRECGAMFHRTFAPPEQAGTCNDCGQGSLYQREDDTEAMVRNRLAVYQDQTAPLIDYYSARGVLISIDGTGQLDDVEGRVQEALRA